MRTLYHATKMSNLASILNKGLELRNAERLVYLCEKPEDCLKFALVRGMQGEVLVVAVQVADKDIIETFDHSPTFFRCRCFASTKPIAAESITNYMKYTI